MPYSDSTRSVSPLLSSSQHARRLRRTGLVAVTLACATLLGGCAIWPKSWSFGSSDTEAAQTQPSAAAAPAAPCADCQNPAEPMLTLTAPAPGQEVKPDLTNSNPVMETQSASVGKIEPMPMTMAPASPAPKAAAPVRTTPAAGLAKGFYINVGLFAVPTNGSNAYQILNGAGLPVFNDTIESKKGTLTRVRVGPFTTQAQAAAAAKKIHGLKLDAVVFKH
jgi:cell division septation protein DedD